MASKYWEKREKKARDQRIKNEGEYNKILRRHMAELYDAINDEINAFYGRYASKEGITLADAKLRAETLDIEAYSRKAERYVREGNFSQQANDEMALYNLTMKVNRLELLKANIALESAKTFSEVEQYVGDVLTEETTKEYERLSGILGQTVGNVGKIDSIVNASFKGATFSENIWGNYEILQNDLSKLLTNALITGKSSKALAPQLKKKFGSTTYEAERLLRTELCRCVIGAQTDSYNQMGFKQYEYMTLSSAAHTASRVCDVCRALDGKKFRFDKMVISENAPPMHPNCRCCIAPYEDDAEYKKWLNETDHIKKGMEKSKSLAAMYRKKSLQK